MRVPFFDLRRNYAAFREEIEAAVLRVLGSGSYILGPEVRAFEEECAKYLGSAFTLGVSSGTDALLVALMALDTAPGDAVATTVYSFFATAEVIARLGARPLFVDIEPGGFCMDPEGLREALRRDRGPVKAVIPVHLYGECADMAAIGEISAAHGCAVIEDAAQAFGAAAALPGGSRARAGAMGDFGCFSFYPSKNLGTMGDGGLISAKDPGRRALLEKIRNHGTTISPYVHDCLGGNFRLDELHAAILRVKLRGVDDLAAARRRVAAWYDGLFEESGLVARGLVRLPREARCGSGEPFTHVRNQYVVLAEERDGLREFLTHAGIGTSVYYPVPLHLQPVFEDLGHRPGDFPRAEEAARRALALPVWPELREDEVAAVVASVSDFFDG